VLNVGDVSFDTRHTPFCSDGCVGMEDTDEQSALMLAEEMISEVVGLCAEAWA
jgi:hypothetical protein